MHGLGHYIYAGEDLPEPTKVASPQNLDLGTAPKPKSIALDIGDDDMYVVLQKMVEYRDQGHSFDKIVMGLEKKYEFNTKTTKYLRDAYND